MSDDFRVGDVIVCVDASPYLVNTPWHLQQLSKLRVGALYRAAGFDRDGDLIDLGTVRYEPDPHPLSLGAFGTHRFRSLPKADEQFTADMRACKPKREPVAC